MNVRRLTRNLARAEDLRPPDTPADLTTSLVCPGTFNHRMHRPWIHLRRSTFDVNLLPLQARMHTRGLMVDGGLTR